MTVIQFEDYDRGDYLEVSFVAHGEELEQVIRGTVVKSTEDGVRIVPRLSDRFMYRVEEYGDMKRTTQHEERVIRGVGSVTEIVKKGERGVSFDHGGDAWVIGGEVGSN